MTKSRIDYDPRISIRLLPRKILDCCVFRFLYRSLL
jgi:hypothetical protein